MPELGQSGGGPLNIGEGIKLEIESVMEQSAEEGVLLVDSTTPGSSPESQCFMDEDSPEMSRRHEEKMELVRLIAEKKRELFGRSYDGCDRSRKEEAWRGVFDECASRGHSWTIGKDWIYLRKSKWPGIKSDALKRREDDPRKSESLKIKANALDGFVRENILGADQNDPNSFAINDDSTITESPPIKSEFDENGAQSGLADLTQANMALVWETLVGRAPLMPSQNSEIPSSSTSSPSTPARTTPAPQPLSCVTTSTVSVPVTRCNSEVRSKYLDNVQLAQYRKKRRLEPNGVGDDVPPKLINGITVRSASPLNGSAFSPVSSSSINHHSNASTLDDLQRQALEAQIEKDRAMTKYYSLQSQIILAQALGNQTPDINALLEVLRDQPAVM